MMNEVLCIVAALGAYSVLASAWRTASLEYYVNVAQASVDASRCVVIFDQIECDDAEVCTHTFDLPFIDLSIQPSWWPAIWEWDFIGRTIVMEHAAVCMPFSIMVDEWPEPDAR